MICYHKVLSWISGCHVYLYLSMNFLYHGVTICLFYELVLRICDGELFLPLFPLPFLIYSFYFNTILIIALDRCQCCLFQTMSVASQEILGCKRAFKESWISNPTWIPTKLHHSRYSYNSCLAFSAFCGCVDLAKSTDHLTFSNGISVSCLNACFFPLLKTKLRFLNIVATYL